MTDTATQEPVKNRSRTCECGKRKKRSEPACPRCAYLDYGGLRRGGPNCNKQMLVIALLMGTDGMSIRELCNAMGRGYSDNIPAMQRTMDSLLEKRRVRRYPREGDEGGAWHWAYALDGRCEDGR